MKGLGALSHAQGALGARRAAYEARWAAFGRDVAAGKRGITFAEVPWPAEDADDMRAVILYGVSEANEVCMHGCMPR